MTDLMISWPGLGVRLGLLGFLSVWTENVLAPCISARLGVRRRNKLGTGNDGGGAYCLHVLEPIASDFSGNKEPLKS